MIGTWTCWLKSRKAMEFDSLFVTSQLPLICSFVVYRYHSFFPEHLIALAPQTFNRNNRIHVMTSTACSVRRKRVAWVVLAVVMRACVHVCVGVCVGFTRAHAKSTSRFEFFDITLARRSGRRKWQIVVCVDGMYSAFKSYCS